MILVNTKGTSTSCKHEQAGEIQRLVHCKSQFPSGLTTSDMTKKQRESKH